MLSKFCSKCCKLCKMFTQDSMSIKTSNSTISVLQRKVLSNSSTLAFPCPTSMRITKSSKSISQWEGMASKAHHSMVPSSLWMGIPSQGGTTLRRLAMYSCLCSTKIELPGEISQSREKSWLRKRPLNSFH